MIKLTHISLLLTICLIACKSSNTDIVSVNPEYFTTENVTVTKVPCELSDGTSTECYKIVTNGLATDHQMGPWCPENITDGAEAGGIWMNDGKVYNVDGEFIKNLSTFYNDSTWMMYTNDGKIIKTSTLEDCTNAATPDVGDAYRNFCVECLPSYLTDVSNTWYIPVTPVLQTETTKFKQGHGRPRPGEKRVPSTRGIALNGVEFSAPAPVNNILNAYTIAPFDDAGGHINIHQGYHYHIATTGISDRHTIAQNDNHGALIGYALDGFGIYELKDKDGNEPTDLDELRGHYDDVRGYHYHVDVAGTNNFINGLKGAYVL
ncbi:YHYH protein [Neotamlana laminarinivorans]|uniref:YHYH protein n=1 Tax=Neotamlana laminarinivorans TaxID=2883124 RepID=A0A9X1L2L8_9FLAO|nr:YHYH protein [Tamlana laminarinivorans]MCB4797729.1 YHYH protein [Tamlana laminarinivorans]